MSPANADIIGAFPNPTIDPIIGLPNYDSISAVHLQLNQNAASADSHVIGQEITRDGLIREKGHQEMRRAFSLWRSGSFKGSPSERTD
jgi:hypothetical protein